MKGMPEEHMRREGYTRGSDKGKKDDEEEVDLQALRDLIHEIMTEPDQFEDFTVKAKVAKDPEGPEDPVGVAGSASSTEEIARALETGDDRNVADIAGSMLAPQSGMPEDYGFAKKQLDELKESDPRMYANARAKADARQAMDSASAPETKDTRGMDSRELYDHAMSRVSPASSASSTEEIARAISAGDPRGAEMLMTMLAPQSVAPEDLVKRIEALLRD